MDLLGSKGEKSQAGTKGMQSRSTALASLIPLLGTWAFGGV